MSSLSLPNLVAARRHLRILTGDDDPIVSWQVFCDSDKERRDLARSFHGRLDVVLPDLERAQSNGCGVFVAVNETDGNGRRKENITSARAAFLDLDGAPLPDSWPEPPHLVVRSSDLIMPKYQVWWRIPETEDFNAWLAFQRLLADRYGGDPKCTMLTQVGRCAGFWHMKDPDRPQHVTIVEDGTPRSAHPTTWPLDMLAEQFGFDLAAAAPHLKDADRDDVIEPSGGWDQPRDLVRARVFLAEPGNWSSTSNGEVSVYKAAAAMRHLGISSDTAEDLITELLPIDVPASWADDHIARKVRNAYHYVAEPPGAASTPEPFDDDLDGIEGEPHRLGGLAWRRASEVEQRNIDWLWPNRIALGKLTGIAGPPDQGKSQVTAAIAAAVTTGGSWPDGGRASVGSVIMLSAEDDAADTTVPRLAAAGADLDRVLLLEMTVQLHGKQRMFNFAEDLPKLERMLQANPDVKLLVVDPISAYLGTGAVNTFKNSEVRGVLAPLGDLAARYGVAVLFVTHFNKSSTGSAINRVTDSGAFTALSRSFWGVMPEQTDGAPTGRKLLVSIKNNIARVKKGMAYTFEDVVLDNGVRTSRVVWGGEVDVTADEVLAGDQELKSSPKLQQAVTFLLDTLGHGPVPSAEVEALAKAAKHADMTMRRARQYLKIEPYQRDGKWWCDLDNGKDTEAEDAEV
jgi:putative DNA primase/helicase